jgi:hypothetical protein
MSAIEGRSPRRHNCLIWRPSTNSESVGCNSAAYCAAVAEVGTVGEYAPGHPMRVDPALLRPTKSAVARSIPQDGGGARY